MTSEQYWKLRAIITECNLMNERAQVLINSASFKKLQILKESGLDPNKNYNLNDETMTVEENK
jgi:hypothetical protein